MSLEGWILIGLLIFVTGVDIVRYHNMRDEVRDLREEVEELREQQDEPQNTTAMGFLP